MSTNLLSRGVKEGLVNNPNVTLATLNVMITGYMDEHGVL